MKRLASPIKVHNAGAPAQSEEHQRHANPASASRERPAPAAIVIPSALPSNRRALQLGVLVVCVFLATATWSRPELAQWWTHSSARLTSLDFHAHSGTLAAPGRPRTESRALVEDTEDEAHPGPGPIEELVLGTSTAGGKASLGEPKARAEAEAETKPKPKPKPRKKRAPPPPPRLRGAMLYPIEELPKSRDACARVLGSSKVALMFLTKGNLFHEPTWQMWFRSAVGALPAEAVLDAACAMDEEESAAAAAACDPAASAVAGDVIAMQRLFSVYVHAPRTVQDADVGQLWRGYLVRHRITARWGTHTLVQATRNLLWEAFRDPANQRFLLLSEADVPIWDPLTLYRQAMSEQRSRVDATQHDATDTRRWTWRMAKTPAQIHIDDWRKSSQWFMLVRSHAEVALQDEAVYRAFEKYCRDGNDKDYHRNRDCYSDEHYLPTLLHLAGLQEETVPAKGSAGGISAVDWSQGGPHPREYTPGMVTAALFTKRLRSKENCKTTARQHAAAQRSAERTFFTLEQAFGEDRDAVCEEWDAGGPSYANASLPPTCGLTARKFGAQCVDAVESLFADCDSGLDLLRGDVCAEAASQVKAKARAKARANAAARAEAAAKAKAQRSARAVGGVLGRGRFRGRGRGAGAEA